MSDANIPEGWYPDPSKDGQHRYWDGQGWTHNTKPSVNDVPTDQPADTPADTPADAPADALADEPADTPAASDGLFKSSLKNLQGASQPEYIDKPVADSTTNEAKNINEQELNKPSRDSFAQLRSDDLPSTGWYKDPNDPSGLRWWDGQAWGPAAPHQIQTEAPRVAAEPAAKSSKGIDAVCWAATWILLSSFQLFIGLVYADSRGSGAGEASAAAVCAVYLAIIGALFVYAGNKSYRLGQQLAVSAFALVAPMLLLSLGMALQWPHISSNEPAEMGAAGLALSLTCGLVAGYGVKKIQSGLSAGILLSAFLSALFSLGLLLGLEDIFGELGWEAWPVAAVTTALIAALALRLEPNHRNMATWIWPTAFYGAVITVILLAGATGGDKLPIILLPALLSGLCGALALVLKRASLLAFAAVGSLISWVWFASIAELDIMLSVIVGLPLSLLVLFGGLWLWRHQEALRSYLPRFISELHSGGPESTLW